MNKTLKILCILFAVLLLASCQSTGKPKTDTEETDPLKEIVYPIPDGKKVVCLDAGHGFRDIGCDTDLMEGTESDVTISITKMLAEKLEKRGVTVILTHDGVSFPSAKEITDLADNAKIEYKSEDIIDNDIFSAYERSVYTSAIAEDKGIDLFISLHVNSIENHPEFSRYELDYYENNPYANALRVFCKEFANDLDNITKIFADPYEEAFLVTKPLTHPSVLIEMGYATNESDAKKLNSAKWREDFTDILSENVYDWISSFEEN